MNLSRSEEIKLQTETAFFVCSRPVGYHSRLTIHDLTYEMLLK
jgi:hypothetical protein